MILNNEKKELIISFFIIMLLKTYRLKRKRKLKKVTGIKMIK
jgi:hypothetical protein